MEESSGAAIGLALVAGEPVWADTELPLSGIERVTAMVELAALAAIVSSLWLMSSARFPPPNDGAAAAPFVGSVAAGLLATRPVRLLVDTRREAKLWPSIAWRSVAVIVLVAAIVANSPRWGLFSTWPLSIAFGAEAALCAWRLGLSVRPWAWYRAFVTSALQLGAVGALAAAIVRPSAGAEPHTAIAYFLMFHFVALLTCFNASALDNVRRKQLEADERDASRIVADEHRRRAHWLHDDVSSQLRMVSLRVQHDNTSPTEVVRLIDELDHTLRLRQLDELLDSGTARLAEIIQPYVRNAQGHGITITAVPTFEDASLIVDTQTGQLFSRAASNFTTNAIQAGATEIGYAVDHDASSIVLRITDNAGGFDVDQAPAGRGLWSVAQQLGAGSITSTRTEAGTTMIARIPIHKAGR